MIVTPDHTHRIVLTKEIRTALGLAPGEPLQISIRPGAVILSPCPQDRGRITKRRKHKVYTGKIPDVDVEDAVNRARHYNR